MKRAVKTDYDLVEGVRKNKKCNKNGSRHGRRRGGTGSILPMDEKFLPYFGNGSSILSLGVMRLIML